MLIVFIFFALIPVMVAAYFFHRSGDMDGDHTFLMLKTFLWGMLGVPLVMAITKLIEVYLHFDVHMFVSESETEVYALGTEGVSLWADFFSGGIVLKVFFGIALLAFLEEYVKHWVVKEVDWNQKTFKTILDGVEFSIAAALGFSLVENVVYFYTITDTFVSYREILPALTLRAVLGTVAHVMFSAVFGYYYGRAKLVGHTKKMHKNHKRKQWHFHLGKACKVRFNRMWHMCSGNNLHCKVQCELHQDELIAEGLLIATILHALFNFTLTMGVGYLVVPMLILEYVFICHELHTHRDVRRKTTTNLVAS